MYSKETRRESREKACLTQGEGSSQPKRANVVDLNLPSQGGTTLEIVVREDAVVGEQAERNEARTTLSQVLESVGLNTPSEGLARGDEEAILEEEESFHVHSDVEAEIRSEMPNVETIVEPPVEEVRELLVEEVME